MIRQRLRRRGKGGACAQTRGKRARRVKWVKRHAKQGHMGRGHDGVSCRRSPLPRALPRKAQLLPLAKGIVDADAPCRAEMRKRSQRVTFDLHLRNDKLLLASRWKEDMAFQRSLYVADDIWRFA